MRQRSTVNCTGRSRNWRSYRLLGGTAPARPAILKCRLPPTTIFTKQSHVTGYVLRAAVREQVLTRAGWRCQSCGVRRRLDVHHVMKRSQGGSDFDLEHLVALCRWCHDQTDAPYERGRLVVTALGAGQFTFEVVG